MPCAKCAGLFIDFAPTPNPWGWRGHIVLLNCVVDWPPGVLWLLHRVHLYGGWGRSEIKEKLEQILDLRFKIYR